MNRRGFVQLVSVILLGQLCMPAAAVSASSSTVRGYDFRDIAARYERPPVDARIDPIWHAIPGLSGWKLNVPESARQTKTADDRKLHLTWYSVAPEVRLASLPPEPIYRGCAADHAVHLMFNVSWGEEYVPTILDTLRQDGVKATFFLDGAWVRKYPDLARRIVAEGHAVGSHGTGHPDFRQLNDNELADQVYGTNQALSHTLGVTSRLLAPPAGSFDPRVVKMARNAGMYTILWTIDTIDWRRPPSRVITTRVTSKAEPGALVLMHPTAPTAKALPDMIRQLRSKGYEFKTVIQLVDEAAVRPPVMLSE